MFQATMMRAFAKRAAQATAVVAVAGTAGAATLMTVSANDSVVHPVQMPWVHGGFFDSYDHASLRRGHQVYKEVCSSCHSMNLITFRTMIGVCYTEEEVKAMAKEVDVADGPNEEGMMFERPGKPFDIFPAPYANDNLARAANGGALPPDLSLITKGRPDGQNYVYALLTGYCDPPTGTHIGDALYYNPYFPGGAIGMPAPLMDEGVEFADGTPATVSQMARDVTTFLSWTAEPEMEERKRYGVQAVMLFTILASIAGYNKRVKWNVLKSRVTKYVTPYK